MRMNDGDLTESGFNDRLLLACRREPVDRAPVWLMRQAGRYMPEYRKLRKKYTFEALSTTPELAARVTMMPVEQLEVDAAILFSDLLAPAACAGFNIEYGEGGPFVKSTVSGEKDVERIKSADLAQSAAHVAETIKVLRQQLTVPLIGFAGAPFTIASYLVEGGPSRHFEKLKTMIFEAPALAWNLFDALSELCMRFLEMQIDAGVQVVQIFDTWAGALSPADFGAFELPWLQRMAMALKRKGIPVIIYVNGVGGILDRLAGSGADIIGIDWRVEITDARKKVGGAAGLQGNLDPAVLLGPDEVIVAKTREILTSMSGSPGFIFNLGHGILPQTEFAKVELLVNTVREFTA
jgi:uroporphyrinogen decarboxylase